MHAATTIVAIDWRLPSSNLLYRWASQPICTDKKWWRAKEKKKQTENEKDAQVRGNAIRKVCMWMQKNEEKTRYISTKRQAHTPMYACSSSSSSLSKWMKRKKKNERRKCAFFVTNLKKERKLLLQWLNRRTGCLQLLSYNACVCTCVSADCEEQIHFIQLCIPFVSILVSTVHLRQYSFPFYSFLLGFLELISVVLIFISLLFLLLVQFSAFLQQFYSLWWFVCNLSPMWVQ